MAGNHQQSRKCAINNLIQKAETDVVMIGFKIAVRVGRT